MANHKKTNHRNGVKESSPPKRTSAGSPANTTERRSAPPTPLAHRPHAGPTIEHKPSAVTRQQIADAAYFLWQQRGGSEIVNWLEAERMLTSTKTTTV